MTMTAWIQENQLVTTVGLVSSVALLFLFKRIMMVHLTQKAQQTGTPNHSSYRILILSLNAPLTIALGALTLALGYWLAAELTGLLDFNPTLVQNFVLTSAILVTVVLLERLSSYGLRHFAANSHILTNSSGIIRGAIRVMLITIGLLMVLSSLGVSVTPLIASLGITSLAVALALQPTLENFFSGVQLLLDKPIRIGDFIELDSGEQGFVERIGWRSTWIKMLPNNIVIMPNSRLCQSKIINYFYPEPELSVPVEVSVHYSSDLEHVERVSLEIAREVLTSHKWGVASYEPFVVFHTFADSGVNFTVMLRTREYFNRFFIKSEFMKRLHQRFQQEGIVIPFPITALNLTQESVPAQSHSESSAQAVQLERILKGALHHPS